jgi:pimeloyl-ACP methyl ester carboxylesterase
LVCPAWWVSHLERDWKQKAFRDFFQALAQHRTVVRYDRPGVGLSSRDRNDFTQEAEVEVLDAIIARLAEPTVELLAFSCAAPVALTWAGTNPERVNKMVFVGAYACGSDLGAENIRDALIALVEAHWGMGAAAINRLFSPDLSSEDAKSYGRDQLASTSAETAAKLLGLSFAMDARKLAAHISCPALVIHRKGDQTVRCRAHAVRDAHLPARRTGGRRFRGPALVETLWRRLDNSLRPADDPCQTRKGFSGLACPPGPTRSIGRGLRALRRG